MELLMSTWKDPRKNLYTITVTSKGNNCVMLIESFTTLKDCQERFDKLKKLYVDDKIGTVLEDYFNVELHQHKLQPKSHI
jgi:hypothetical protein